MLKTKKEYRLPYEWRMVKLKNKEKYAGAISNVFCCIMAYYMKHDYKSSWCFHYLKYSKQIENAGIFSYTFTHFQFSMG